MGAFSGNIGYTRYIRLRDAGGPYGCVLDGTINTLYGMCAGVNASCMNSVSPHQKKVPSWPRFTQNIEHADSYMSMYLSRVPNMTIP